MHIVLLSRYDRFAEAYFKNTFLTPRRPLVAASRALSRAGVSPRAPEVVRSEASVLIPFLKPCTGRVADTPGAPSSVQAHLTGGGRRFGGNTPCCWLPTMPTQNASSDSRGFVFASHRSCHLLSAPWGQALS